ncbi:MAG: two-component regulator propeller domain-containing protein [Acidobacteriota bacterium]|nr:two-component regulator propeller domain-containing protein [Acidobacteriota bacterium]
MQSYRFEHISSQKYSANTNIECILQDSLGWMWFGTESGLLRFDGFGFKEWKNTAEKPDVLAGDKVRSLYEDDRGSLWVGTSNGLSRYDRDSDTFTHFLPDKNTPGKLTYGDLRAIAGDHEGAVWISSAGRGLYTFQPHDSDEAISFQYFHKGSARGKLISNWVHALFVDRAGTLWIGTLDGLMQREPAGLPEVHNLPLKAGESQILAIYENRGGFLWLGAQNDILRYDRKTGKLRSLKDKLSTLQLTGPLYPAAIVEDLDGRIWTATYSNGLVVYEPGSGKIQQFLPDRTAPAALRSKLLTSLVMDRTGLLWIGSKDRGLFMHNPETRRFGHTLMDYPGKSLRDLGVSAVYEEESGDLWLGGREGVHKFDRDGKLTARLTHDPRKPEQSICFGRITTILSDHRGDMWIGTNGGGISRVSRGGLGPIQNYHNDGPESLAHDAVNKIFETRRHELWIGTMGAGLDLFEDGRFVHFWKGPDSISHNTINDLTEDRKGRLWVATGDGLCFREDGVFKQLRHDPDNPQSIDGNQVFHLLNGRDGKLWAATQRGLNRLVQDGDGFAFIRFGADDGLTGSIMDMQEDHTGNLWISTSSSLMRFDPERRLSRIYDTRDGMQSDSFIRGAAFSRAGGRLFFGGETGFNAFNPADIEDNAMPPPIFITSLQLFDRILDHRAPGSPLTRPINRTQKVVFDHNDNFLTFEFAALDYAAPERNRYAFKMEGLDEVWRYTDGEKNHVAYANLAPGNYVFQVKGSNRDGYWQGPPRTLRVSITPPLWATRWAYALYILLLVLLVSGYLRTQKRRLARERRINEDLDRKVSERTRDLEARNREILQQQQKLRNMDRLKTRFFTNLSHEFRTPLTLMLGPMEDILDQREAPPAEMRSTIQSARRHSLRLLQMINELLDVSKLEAGQMTLRAQEADLAAFVALCAAPFQAVETKGECLKLKLPDQPVPVFFDPGHLEKVFSNLIMNAFKHIPENGRIVIALQEEKDRVKVSVQDNGSGIPADRLEHIFDRFYQAESNAASRGTGIGLSLAQELVTLHGGQIEVESETDFGSTFTVTLQKGRQHLRDDQLVTGDGEPAPLRLEEVPADPADLIAPVRVDATSEKKGRLSILLIEDHLEIQAYLHEILDTHYDVYSADTGEKGLAEALAKIPDLVICDVMLPDIDGLDICRQIKKDERTSHIPVVVLTARTTAEQNVAGLEAGADAYITKPFSSRVLHSQIENLIRNRRLLQERFSHKITAAATEIDVVSSEESFVHKAVSIMEAHLKEPDFGVNELAVELGLSRRQLHRKLTAITAKTPFEILRGIRLDRAAQLLRQNTDQVSQIAYRVGFSQTKHFSKLFREAYGQTPSEYAARYKSQK